MISVHSSSVGAGTGHDCDPQTHASQRNSVARSEVLISRSGTPSNSGDASFGHGRTNFSIPSSRSLIGVADGEGGSALAQAKRRAPGRGLPPGWWILPAIILGAAMWTGAALAISDVAGWL